MDNCSSKCSNYSPIEITSDILFTPPLTDKVTSIGGREKIPAYFLTSYRHSPLFHKNKLPTFNICLHFRHHVLIYCHKFIMVLLHIGHIIVIF